MKPFACELTAGPAVRVMRGTAFGTGPVVRVYASLVHESAVILNVYVLEPFMPRSKVWKLGPLLTSTGAVIVVAPPCRPKVMLALMTDGRSTDQSTTPTVGIPPWPTLSAVWDITVNLQLPIWPPPDEPPSSPVEPAMAAPAPPGAPPVVPTEPATVPPAPLSLPPALMPAPLVPPLATPSPAEPPVPAPPAACPPLAPERPASTALPPLAFPSLPPVPTFGFVGAPSLDEQAGMSPIEPSEPRTNSSGRDRIIANDLPSSRSYAEEPTTTR